MQNNLISIWQGTTPETNYPALDKNISIDVAIVGGGIAGITAAYSLMKEGNSVAIFEAERIASNTSGNTTAKVTSIHDLKYAFLEKKVGSEGARIYAQSNEWAIGELQRIITEEKIDCDFCICSAYAFAETKQGLERVKEEVEAAKRLGIKASFLAKDDALPFAIEGEIRFENQAYFHPRKYLLAIAEILTKNGVHIFEHTRIEDVTEDAGCTLTTGQHIINAKKVIIATNYPIIDKALFFLRMHQMRSYALAVKLDLPVLEGMYIGIDEEQLTLRPYRDQQGEWLVVGGQDHVTGDMQKESPFESLEHSVRKLFPVTSVDYQWAAQDSTPIDRIPCIGKMPQTENIYVATGFSEWGMTTSFVSAKILSDAINGRNNDWEKLYTPFRFKPEASLEGISSQLSHVAKGFGSYVTKNEPLDSTKIQAGEGGVVSHKGEKVAVYKDEEGAMHGLSAKCTHMKCIVNWNAAEKSWDCPCHGSRFNTEGEVLNSPAIKPLRKEKLN